MPLNKSIIALPAMPQSYLQMLHYYMGCQVKAAVRHLITLPTDRWPNDWFNRPTTENDWSVSIQSYYATRITSPLPVPTPQAALLENTLGAEILQQLLLQMDPGVFRMADRIRGFLPDWNNSKCDEFEGAWWLGGQLKPNERMSWEFSAVVCVWAYKYFQSHWKETLSPIDAMHHHALDVQELSLLKKLQRCLKEVSISEKDMVHFGRHAEQLHIMLERRVLEREHNEDIYENMYPEV